MGYARYDYAWQTPGWSAQNPVINNGVDGYVDPGFPTDVALVRVYGRFLEFDSGRGLEGVLRIRLPQTLTHVATGQQVMAGELKPVRFREDGFSIYLPATDDEALSPSSHYEAKLTVRGVVQEFEFTLSTTEPEVNITTLIQRANEPVDSGSGAGDEPAALDVNLTTGADFHTMLTGDYPVNAKVALVFDNNDEWVATVSGRNAIFLVDKDIANLMPDGMGVRLVVTVDSDDQVWTVGKVVRHG